MFKVVLERIVLIAGALMGAQVPEFLQQYKQRLAGHLDEINRLVLQMKQAALQSGKTLEQYIEKFKASSDVDFSSQGLIMDGMLRRLNDLETIYKELTTSPAWERPFLFIRSIQIDIVNETLKDFQPGIKTTVEGLVYIFLGALTATGLFYLFSFVVNYLIQQVKNRCKIWPQQS